jgi:hypothetical protein
MYRTDNGELKNEQMKNWLESRGTVQQFTAPYTSAHIGCVERLHRTLMNKARTMRLYSGLPPQFWDEFYLTATHLHAKTTSKTLKGTTPWQLWYNRKPDLSYLREPGCRAFVLIVNKNNPKIYERSIECILLGYNPDSKTYRCYDPKTKQIYSSYHVQFLESHDGYLRVSNSTTDNTTIATPSLPATIISPPSNVTTEVPDNPAPLKKTPVIPLENAQPPNVDVIPEELGLQPPHAINPGVPPPIAPEPPISVRTSSRLANRPVHRMSRLETAIQDSLASANRVRAQREQRRLDLQELHDNRGNEIPIDEAEELAMALNSLDLLTGADHNVFAASTIFPTNSTLEPPYENDPLSWAEAQSSAHGKEWRLSFQEELDSLNKMGVYELIPRSSVPLGQRIHTGKLVFHVKRDANGDVCQRKVCLVF